MSDESLTGIPEDLQQAAPPRRTDTALLLALGETRAAAKQAAETSSRVETAVGGLTLRVGALEVDVATIKAQKEAEKDAAAPKVHPTTYLSLGISVLLAILILIQDFSLPSSP